jgi:hypothetical protein
LKVVAGEDQLDLAAVSQRFANQVGSLDQIFLLLVTVFLLFYCATALLNLFFPGSDQLHSHTPEKPAFTPAHLSNH